MTNTLIGQTLGKYDIIESVGSGGMAEVYRALQQPLEREVAIKVLHPHLVANEDLQNRFFREAKAIASLRHPHIIQIYDYDVSGETYFMAMEFLRGKSLEDYITQIYEESVQMPPIPVQDALKIASDIASALDYSHKHGMVHRDVKPANIMRTAEGHVILTDFGIATMLNATRITRDGSTSGTPAYMSPEQALGQQGDHRSDIYSLGAVLYELVTGQQPFESDTLYGLIMKQVNEPPPPPTAINPTLSPLVERVIEKAMAKDPEQRYQTAAEFAADIDRVAQATQSNTENFSPVSNSPSQSTLIADRNITRSHQAPHVPPPPSPPSFWHSYKRRIGAGVAALALLIALTIGFRPTVFFPTPEPAVEEVVDSMAAESVDSMAAEEAVDSMAADGVDSMASTPLNQPYEETFDDNTAGWTLSESPITRAVSDGSYLINLEANGRAIASYPENAGEYSRFSYSVEATLMDGQVESGYGLVFHRQDSQNYYVFAVNGMQQWSIWRLREGAWHELREIPNESWTYAEAVNPAGETNQITIEVLENTLNLFVNDVQLTQLTDTDATFTQGGIGFYTASSRTAENALAHIEFDNISLQPITDLTVPAMTDS